MKNLNRILIGFFVGLGLMVILLSILQSSPAAANAEIPENVQLAEQLYQEATLTASLAEEAAVQANGAWMEAEVVRCLAWKSLAYDKWNAGMEISTPIQDVERTLCLAPSTVF